jgi:hypothetical protein
MTTWTSQGFITLPGYYFRICKFDFVFHPDASAYDVVVIDVTKGLKRYINSMFTAMPRHTCTGLIMHHEPQLLMVSSK